MWDERFWLVSVGMFEPNNNQIVVSESCDDDSAKELNLPILCFISQRRIVLDVYCVAYFIPDCVTSWTYPALCTYPVFWVNEVELCIETRLASSILSVWN